MEHLILEVGPFLDMASYVGVIAFALSAALVGAHKRMNVMGVVVMGAIVAVSGPAIRDVLLGITPVSWVIEPSYVFVAILAALAVVPLSRIGVMSVLRQFRLVSLADAAGQAVFVVIGASTALAAGADEFAAILVGTVTGIAGGIIRDLLAGEVPDILVRGLHATAAVVGAALFVFLDVNALVPKDQAVGLAAMVGFGIRLIGIVLKLGMPTVVLKPPKA